MRLALPAVATCAQRPKASSSGSPVTTRFAGNLTIGAQRPKASSSGSRRHDGPLSPREAVLNARRRHRRVHHPECCPVRARCGAQRPKASSSGSPRTPVPALMQEACSTPEGVIVGFTHGADSVWQFGQMCSTPEGVIVGFTRTRWRGPPPDCSAQRPKASSSGSHRVHERVRGSCRVLNARRRHRRVHAKAGPGVRRVIECSTPEGVIVGFTGHRRDCRGRRPRVLNARRRHRRVHDR